MLRLATEWTKKRKADKIILYLILLLIPMGVFSQESTLDNQQGPWSDDAIWLDGTAPGTSGINTDVHIYGTVVCDSDLDFTGGDLFIHDTLTLFGSLTIGDTLNLTVDPGAVLIVRGDFTCGDTVDVWTSGEMVVTGEFSILGDDDQGSFDNDGQLYVFDATPVLKSGAGYGDFTCVDLVDSCTLYDESDLLASALAPLYLSGSYFIEPSGLVEFCLGDSVLLSVTDTATSYQWFADDIEIVGATTFEYRASATADYHVTFFIGGDSLVMEAVAVTTNPLPVVSIIGLDVSYCEGAPTDTLVGDPANGFFLAAPGISILGGDSAVFDPALAGSYDIQYYYTDLNGCTDTALVTAVVNPLPVVDYAGLDPVQCPLGDPDTLVGNHAPDGIFSGGTVADQGDGTGIFTPLLDGTYEIWYAYTDLNGCTDSMSYSVLVHPLTPVAIDAYDTIWDINDPAFVLAGSPAGGTFTGNGVSGPDYDPALAGVGLDTLVYAYTDGNSCTNYDTLIFEIRDYDFMAGARILNDIDNWCSPDAYYTTIGATADESAGSCWIDGPNNNRWFMFQATTDQVFVEVKTGAKGTIRRPQVALWDTLGAELACQIYWADYEDVNLGYIGLTPGEWYFISVDNRGTNYGSFALCVDDSVDYDFREGAISVPHTNSWRSADEEFTTRNATADRLAGSCWSYAVNSNRWFTFTALEPNVSVDVLTGGDEGSMQYPLVALWNEAGDQVACANYISQYGDIRMSIDSLTVGNQYYISVDNRTGTGRDGTFSLAVSDTLDYDFQAGAIEIPHTGDWRSPDEEYTTLGATADGPLGACWNSNPAFSRWFTFVATGNEVTAELLTGGDEGTLRRGFLLLTDELGTELACARYYSDYSDIKLGFAGLIPGERYYIIVDNYYTTNPAYRGTFSLALDNEVDYDFREGAFEITDPHDWCSADAQFTTLNASPDRDSGTCWPNGPNFNRWFRFTATTTETMVRMKTGAEEGTLRRGMIALWNEAGDNLACGRYVSDYTDINMGYTLLTPGETYYISVDNYYTDNTGYRGTFTLCVDDSVDYDYPEGAELLTDLNNWCSPLEAYTTINATGDTLAGSCWPTGPSFDRWFRFQATSNELLVRMLTGGAEGTLRRGLVAIWDDAFNEIACNRYTSDNSDVHVGTTSLTPGDWYYISVDNYYTTNSGYRGTFSLCVSDVLDYDFREGAYEISDIDSWCSADAEFSTLGATADGVAGSCWPNGPNYNRWFRFQATGNEAMFDIQIGAEKGTMDYPMAALYDTLGNEVACATYYSQYGDVSIGSTTLVAGEWYFLTVDNRDNTGYRGTFTLCADDQVDYDYKLGAIELTDIDNWCSPLEAYSTLGASPDELAGSCWIDGPNYNRWFRFQATTSMVQATILTGGTEGTMDYILTALWDSLGNELACNQYTAVQSDVSIGYAGLIPGEWYYLSVDNRDNTGYRGTFSLCMDDTVDYDYPEGAVEISSIIDYCSADAEFSTLGATADYIQPANWTEGPNYNRWFRFQATASGEATISLKTGGPEGDLEYPMLAVWDTTLTELDSRSWINQYGNLEIGLTGLVPGDWYFISVDNRINTGYRGSFTLCVDDEISYDYFAGAIELSDIDGWCSDYAIFSTEGGTPDESMGSCWHNGPNYNRWFRFQATSTDIAVQVRSWGIEGTVRRAEFALWDTLKNELACSRWYSDYGDGELYATGLTVGDWYYISVDNATGGTPGSFTLCVTDHAVNDFMADAITIADLNNWCGEDAQYSNILGTADESQGSCWTGVDNKNVWFRFLATSTRATVRVTTGGDYGQMVNQQVAVWDASSTEVTCAGPYAGQGELTALPTGMTIGNWYYISVDDDGTPGTFTLCIDDTIDYDYPEGAVEITDPGNWCSPDASFSNASATADTDGGSCWVGSNFQNVWFTFVAESEVIDVQVKTGTVYGSMDRQQVALFDVDGNEVACAGASITEGTLHMQIDTLTLGNRYYIAVDNDDVDPGNTGTFTLCTDTILSYDFRAGAEEVQHNYCSAEAEYDLRQATADGAQASCWGGSTLTNVWFKFQASTPYVTVSLKSAGVYGTLRRGQMAIWNAADEEVACKDAVIQDGTLLMMADTLTVGDWYWIAVDVDEDGDNQRLGTFSLCLEDALDYDQIEGALEIPHDYGCSGDAAFSNYHATDDGNMGSCWATNTPNRNVWFMFQATTPYAKVELKTGDVLGTMRRGQIAIFNTAGVEVACINDIVDRGTTLLMTDTLTVGDWYWISVDDDQNNGTFTLCLDDELNYDYHVGALEIPHDYGCSADAEFSNDQATDDELPGSCWDSNSPHRNVWFKFQATTSDATVQIKSGSVYGTMQRPHMAMWNAAMDQVVCTRDLIYQGTLEMTIDTLTPGAWYWISVDDDQNRGSFTLCLDDELSFNYKSGAEEILHNMGCSADGAYTNRFATADEVPGSCWDNTNSLQNVWFKFRATSRFLTFDVRTGSVLGTMQRQNMALFNEAGQEVACIRDVVYQGTNTLSADTLTVGDWYYISVDDDQNSGSFSFCISDQPSYNYWEGAEDLLHDMGCSADAEYSNANATEDMLPGSCWSANTPNRNVWFRFVATSPNVTVSLRSGTVYGTMRRPQMALWNDSFQEVACIGRPASDYGTSVMSMDSLTIGNTYYISVDDDNVAGSFTICLSDEATYDFFGGALELPHNGGCSTDAAYDNRQATADRSMGSCWSGIDPDDNMNVWFRFQALTTDVTLTVRNSGVFGSLRRPQTALWDASGVEIKCMPTTTDWGDFYLSYDGLTPGDWYYVSVDNGTTVPGTFTLCIDDFLNYDYKGGAYEITNPIRWCSADEEFSNRLATPDEIPGSCWEAGENKNVWFKFTANSENVVVDVRNGTGLGSLRDLQASLWNENGDELDCAFTNTDFADIQLQSDTLTIGNTYYISVDDSQTSNTFTLCVNTDPLDAELVGTNVSCNGADDGSIVVTATGGTGSGYTYDWTRNGVSFIGSDIVTGLDPATYEVTVTDAGDPATTVVLSYIVTEAPALTLSLSKVDDNCPGEGVGSVTATAGGGAGSGYSYEWYRNDISIIDNTSTIINLDAAEYKVIVTDVGAPACTISDSIVVVNTLSNSVAPTGISITNDSTCQGTTKDLSVVGGSLGDGADWQWYADAALLVNVGSGSPFTVDPAYDSVFYVRAEGTCGNSVEVSQLVEVIEPTAPLPDVDPLTDVTAQCSVAALTAPTATANCAGTITGTHNATLPITTQGTTIVTWTYDDGDGNVSTQNQNVIIDDITPPTASNPLPATVQCQTDVPLPDVTVVTDEADNCGVPVVAFVSDVTDGGTCPEIITRTYSVTDVGNNVIYVNQLITVNDVSALVLPGNSTSTVECAALAVNPGPPADITDGCGRTISPVLVGSTETPDPVTCEGTVVWTYRYTACDGVTTSDWTYTYTVDQTTAPAEVGGPVPTSSTVECAAAAVAPTLPVVHDVCGNILTPTGPVMSGTYVDCEGTIIYTYTYTSCDGVTSFDWVYTYTVDQTTAPAEVGGPVPTSSTVECASAAVAPTLPVVHDVCGNVVTPTGPAMSGTYVDCEGTIIYTYTYTSCDGVTSFDWVYIYTVDYSGGLTPPASTTSTVSCPADATDPGAPASITDACGRTVVPVLVGSTETPDPIICNGQVVWTYSYTACDGTTADWTHTYTVNDVIPPTASDPAPINVECITDIPVPDISVVTDAADNCTATPVVAFVSDVSDGNNCPMIITRTYSVTDICGNSIDVTQFITVSDNTPPTPVCRDITVQLDGTGNATITAADIDNGSSDNCSVDTIWLDVYSFDCTNVGSNTVNLTVEDDCGNQASCSATVTVENNILPTITCPVDVTETAPAGNCSVVVNGIAPAAIVDNCMNSQVSFRLEGATTGTGLDDASGTVFNKGITTVWYRITDPNDNTDSCSFNVTVLTTVVPPTSATSDPDSVCAGVGTIMLSYSGGVMPEGGVAMWYDDAGLTSNIGSGDGLIIPSPLIPTTYFVRFEGSCDTTSAVSTTVYAKLLTVEPDAAYVDRSAVCPGDGFITLSYGGGDPGSNGSAVWYDDAALSSAIGTGNNLLISAPTVTTIYHVRFEADCDTSSAVSVEVTVWPVPEPGFAEMTENACIDGPLYLYVASGMPGSVFNWNITNGSIVDNYNDSIYVDWGDQVVTGTLELTEISVNGCVSAPLTLQVAVDELELDLGDDIGTCFGTPVTIDPEGDFATYLWQDGSTASVYTTDQEGWIRLEVTDTNGCSGADSLYVSVYDLPEVDLGPDTTACGETGIVLDAGNDGDTYEWSTGDISQSITVYEGPAQDVWVLVTDANGCTSGDTVSIGECNVEFYFRDIPTAITPGMQDGINDTWIIEKLNSYSQAEVLIYDRWGILVWKSEPGYSVPWDGNDMRGRAVPMDSYHFVIKLNTGADDDSFTGIITVIR